MPDWCAGNEKTPGFFACQCTDKFLPMGPRDFSYFTTREISERIGRSRQGHFCLRPPFVVSGAPDKEPLEFPEGEGE